MEQFIFHHVGIAVREIGPSVDVFSNLFNYKVVSGPFDDPIQKVSVCFLRRGEDDPALELVAPIGEDSPVRRTLEKGGGTYHVCYQVKNIEASIDFMIGQGALKLSGPVPAVAFQMRPIAWLMTSAKLLVELVQSE